MSARTKGRRRAAAAVVARARTWAATRDDVAAVALVGSYAAGRAHHASDVDLIVLADDPDALLADLSWLAAVTGGGTLVRAQSWGAITERRVRRRDGLLVEVNVGTPSWAAVDPLDDGTARVVADGAVVVHDPRELLEALVGAVAAHARRPTPPGGGR